MTRLKLAICMALLGVVVTATVAVAGGRSQFRAELDGYQEVPLTISTPGHGSFRAAINRSAQTISYVLTYRDLTTAVQQAHIHLGRPAVAGGIIVFLCSNLGNGPAGTQACPQGSGRVTGTIRPEDVRDIANQNVAAGDFGALVRAIRATATYANVHTVKFPAGEIRGQIVKGRHRDRGNNDD